MDTLCSLDGEELVTNCQAITCHIQLLSKMSGRHNIVPTMEAYEIRFLLTDVFKDRQISPLFAIK
jgi:hypothetical protein